MSSTSLREQAAEKEREWRELEQLQYDDLFFRLFIRVFLLYFLFILIFYRSQSAKCLFC